MRPADAICRPAALPDPADVDRVAPYELLTPEIDALIVRLYDDGLQVPDIARLTGTSNGSVYSALRRQKRRPDRAWENREHRPWYGRAEPPHG